MAYKKSNPNGQATMANSEPVVLASDQAAIPVTVSGVATAAKQDTIIGHVDGIETLLGTTNSTLSTIDGRVDGIEALIGTTNSTLTTIDGRVDGIETLLTAIDGHVDGIETINTAIQTSVQLIDDAIQVLGTDTYTEATSKGMTFGAVRRDADTTLVNTTNEFAPLQVDARGFLKVEAFSGETLPVSLTSTTVTGSVAITAASGSIASGAIASGAIASGAVASGAVASGAIAVGAIAAGATSIATTEDSASAAADHLVKVAQVRLDTPVANANVSNDGDYTQFIADNFGKLWISGTVPEDVAHIGGESIMRGGVRRIDTPATSAGSSGDRATMDASAEGALRVTTTPTTTGGLSTMNATSSDGSTALTSTAQVIKASAGNLYGYYIYNPNATAQFVQFYNTAAASVTVGTTNPLFMLPIPAMSGANLMFTYPIAFSNAGRSWAATSTAGGNGAPTTALDAVCRYK